MDRTKTVIYAMAVTGGVPILVCVRGASIGFVSHKTAGRAKGQPDTQERRKRHEIPDTGNRDWQRTE